MPKLFRRIARPLFASVAIPWFLYGQIGSAQHSFAFDFSGSSFELDGTTISAEEAIVAVSAARSSLTSAGLLVEFAPNTPRITDLGLAVEPALTQILPYSEPGSPNWTYTALTGALDAVGPTGAAASAYTLTDASASTGIATRDTADLAATYANQVLHTEVFVSKYTADATNVVAGFRLRRLGGAVPDTTFYINRRTGAYLGAVGTLPADFAQSITSCGNFWRFQVAYNHADNTTLSLRVVPAANTAGTAATTAATTGVAIVARAGVYHGPAVSKPDFMPLVNASGAASTAAADQITLNLPRGTYDITVTFSDDSTVALLSQVVVSSGWLVPTDLARAVIASISGTTSASGNNTFEGNSVLFEGNIVTFEGN